MERCPSNASGPRKAIEAAATELVGRLDAPGWIVRHADPEDKRRPTLELTEKAEALLVRLSSVHLREIREIAPELIALLQRLQRASYVLLTERHRVRSDIAKGSSE